MIALAANVFIWTRKPEAHALWPLSLFITGLFLALMFGAWFDWRALVMTEYLKINEHAEYLIQRPSRDGEEARS